MGSFAEFCSVARTPVSEARYISLHNVTSIACRACELRPRYTPLGQQQAVGSEISNLKSQISNFQIPKQRPRQNRPWRFAKRVERPRGAERSNSSVALGIGFFQDDFPKLLRPED